MGEMLEGNGALSPFLISACIFLFMVDGIKITFKELCQFKIQETRFKTQETRHKVQETDYEQLYK
jgi:hypothetical protein